MRDSLLDPEFQRALIVNLFNIQAELAYDEYGRPAEEILAGYDFEPAHSHSSRLIAPIAAWLSDNGIVACSEHARGGTAQVFIGKTQTEKYCAIRIPTKFDRWGDHSRLDHPAVLQPFAALPYKSDTKVEILPFVHIVQPFKTTKNIPDFCSSVFKRVSSILQNFYTSAGLICPEGLRDSVGILPDSTPAIVDPDTLKLYHPAPSQEQQMASLRSAAGNDIAGKVLSPFLADGRWKQRVIFPADYLTTPLRPLYFAPNSSQEFQL